MAALALFHILPHPHPEFDEAEVSCFASALGGAGVVAVEGVREIGDAVLESGGAGDTEPEFGSSGTGAAPTFTLSPVDLRSVGVPALEGGLSICEREVRGGAELFWVISSMKA